MGWLNSINRKGYTKKSRGRDQCWPELGQGEKVYGGRAIAARATPHLGARKGRGRSTTPKGGVKKREKREIGKVKENVGKDGATCRQGSHTTFIKKKKGKHTRNPVKVRKCWVGGYRMRWDLGNPSKGRQIRCEKGKGGAEGHKITEVWVGLAIRGY